MLITCSNCQAKIRVPDSAAGKRGKCPKCDTVITIPLTDESAETPPPKPVEPAAGGSPFDFGGEPEQADEAPPPPRRKSTPATSEVDEAEPAPDEIVEDEAPAVKKPKEESLGLSITALVLGSLTLLCGCFSYVSWCAVFPPLLLSIGAGVTGYMGMKKGGRRLAIIGMCVGGAGLLISIIGVPVNLFLIGPMVFNLLANKAR